MGNGPLGAIGNVWTRSKKEELELALLQRQPGAGKNALVQTKRPIQTANYAMKVNQVHQKMI